MLALDFDTDYNPKTQMWTTTVDLRLNGQLERVSETGSTKEEAQQKAIAKYRPIWFRLADQNWE